MLSECELCGKPFKSGQIRSGVQLGKDEPEVVGHYLCVVKELKKRDPELPLEAMQDGLLPMYDPKTIKDGRLPKYQEGSRKPQYLMEEQVTKASSDDDDQ